MKTYVARLAILCSLTALAGCNWGNHSAQRDDHNQTPGEQAGRAAYELQKDTKKAAKELGHDLNTFGRDAREGFQEQKQKDQAKREEQPAKPRDHDDTK